MSRTSLITILVFIAGLGSGSSPGALPALQRRTQAADLAAIEKLNQEDIEATLTQEPKRLMDLWAENAVVFYPGSPPAVGREAIAAHNAESHAKNPGLKVLSHTSSLNSHQGFRHQPHLALV